MMYDYPPEGVRNYSSPPDPVLLSSIENQLSWFDETAYLAPATRAQCSRIIFESGIVYDSAILRPGLHETHTQAYRVLRAGLFAIEQAGVVVEELQPPVGSLDLIERMVQEVQAIEGMIPMAVGPRIGEFEELEEVEEVDEDNEGDQMEESDAEDDLDDGIFFEP
jgi:hypothetical protein